MNPTTSSASAECDALRTRVAAEHTRLLFESSWVSGATAPVVTAILCWVLWPHVEHSWLIGWWALKTAVAATRLSLREAWRRDRPELQGRWTRWLLVAFAADGVTYGFIGTVFMPADGIYRALMLATVVAIAGVGQIVVATHARGAAWFVLPLVLPVMVMQLLVGDRIGLFAALGLAVFVLILGQESLKATATTLATLRLRFEFDDLAQERADALEAAQRHAAVKDRFLATMSHEMRTPLHGVLGLARLAQSDAVPGTSAARHLVTLQRTGAHLLAVLNDVLDFSRIQSGYLQTEQQPFNLTQLLETVSDLSSVTAHDKGLQFELEHSFDSPRWVLGDATRLRQILLNLTGNAVKFTSQGRVRLSVRCDDGALTVFDVADTGPGIDPADASAVFDAFRQADDSDRRRHGGTGLGLTISRELAQAMGGTLDLLPPARADLPGATFRLVLPLAPSAAPDTSPSSAKEAALPARTNLGGHVLVVEDNDVNALIAEAMLRDEGLRVDLAPGGEAALELVAERRYTLILMDCQMPGMDGYETTRSIREMESTLGRARVPIVAVTAHGLEDDRRRSLEAGMDEHLCKPFAKEDLLQIVRRLAATLH